MRPLAFLFAITACGNPATDNRPPEIVVEHAVALSGVPIELAIRVDDPDDDAVTVTAHADHGELGDDLRYTAPELDHDVVHVVADDGHGNQAEADLAVTIGRADRFAEPIAITATVGNSKAPTILVASDGALHVVWHDFSTVPSTLGHAAHQAGTWSAASLPTTATEAVLPRLVRDGDRLHLFWEEDLGGPPLADNDLRHAVLVDGAWSDSESVGSGRRISATVADGVLHAAFFHDGAPVHTVRGATAWSAPEAVPAVGTNFPIDRLKLVTTAAGVELAVAIGTPDVFDRDIRVFRWTAAAGFAGERTLFHSREAFSDETEGAVDPSGVSHWVWAEDFDSGIGIAERASDETGALRYVAKDPTGQAMQPAIAIPGDGRAIVAWTTPAETIAIARAPYAAIVPIGGTKAFGAQLAVDARGFTHLVYSGRDANLVEQIWYTSNEP